MTELAVVWDMGGVFTRYFTEILVDVGRERGWPLHRLPLGPTGEVDDPDYVLMWDGGIEEGEYLHRCLERLRSEGIDFDPRGNIDWDEERRPHTWGLIHRVHDAGRTQGILTNDASKWMGDNWWDTWEPARMFQGLVDVATLTSRKPAPEPYLAACAAIGRSPETCIFVDDMRINCRGAEAVGMQSQLFDITDPAASIAALSERIGLA
jgi:FMN phosphatase YigB (HAD superfamily)